MERRLNKSSEKLADLGLDGLLVTGQENIYYLTDFWGTAATVFISKNRRIFVTDARYSLIARQSVTGFEIVESREALAEIARLMAGEKLERIGFDSQVTFAYYQQLQAVFAGYELVPVSRFVEDLRMVKDASEIATIREACRISDQAFLDVLDFIKPNQTTEREVANFLDFRMRQYGATGVSFETIVASGPRSAMPHGLATDKVIALGEMLTLDFGCIYQHYASDMTRTIHIGPATDEEREVYDTVLRANQALIAQAREGMTYRDYDRVPREIITQAGYGPYFTHGIGHGMGLDVHEFPYFGQSDDCITAGMVLTDEPGIYLDGRFGVRIEDDLLITQTGCEVLTQTPKDWMVIS